MYIQDVEFQWDEKKYRENLRKHGLSFEDADLVFLSPDRRERRKYHDKLENR